MKVLHAGCGNEPLPAWIGATEEVRLDIDKRCAPDVVASLSDLGEIGEFDAVYCSHALEHLAPHEIERALLEFRRVLREGGSALLFVPDIEDVKPTDAVLFVSPAGPITGLDLLYGKREMVEKSHHMSHRFGFTQKTLADMLNAAGFSRVLVDRHSCFNLMAAVVK